MSKCVDRHKKNKNTTLEHEIEEILDHRTVNGKQQYFIKWFDESGTNKRSWELEENILDKELIVDYHNIPETIDGATEIEGILHFFVTKKNGEKEIRISSYVYKKCPHLAVKFFEKHLDWDVKKSNNTRARNAAMIRQSDEILAQAKKMAGKKSNMSKYRPAGISGCLKTSGGLVYKMHWRNTKKYDYLPANVIYEKFIYYVLRFFEEKIVWKDVEETVELE